MSNKPRDADWLKQGKELAKTSVDSGMDEQTAFTYGYLHGARSTYTQERERADRLEKEAEMWAKDAGKLEATSLELRAEVERLRGNCPECKRLWDEAERLKAERDQLRTMCDRLAEALRCYDNKKSMHGVRAADALAEYERMEGGS